jgi:hypothetical protein
MGSFRYANENTVTLLRELFGARSGSTSDTSASTTFTDGPAGAAPLIYASAATVAATSETATVRPTVIGDFMWGSFASHAWHDGSAQWLHSTSRWLRVRPAQWTSKSDAANVIAIPFGHAFDRREISWSKSAVRSLANAVVGLRRDGALDDRAWRRFERVSRPV